MSVLITQRLHAMIRSSFLVVNSYTVLPSGVLQLNEVTRTDGGLYRCRAVNMAKERHSSEARLTVLPPTSKLL